ncbi:hypothetical protein CPB83DRAFT_415069 [Crepidotus variabilis]|uniref:Uncharacterized protein n=1 Tax=Crepidotus variabilis TaxID=179855 RepID=A0A9P6ES78_9AGAR|nr:hypothetical protein CPB83DRAFT_415069 [Crepidotus variabilis]
MFLLPSRAPETRTTSIASLLSPNLLRFSCLRAPSNISGNLFDSAISTETSTSLETHPEIPLLGSTPRGVYQNAGEHHQHLKLTEVHIYPASDRPISDDITVHGKLPVSPRSSGTNPTSINLLLIVDGHLFWLMHFVQMQLFPVS